MIEPDKEAHIKELIDARATIARQIEIFEGAGPYEATNRKLQIGELIKQLRGTLRALDECISTEQISREK